VHELTRAVEHDGISDEVAVEEPLEIRVDGVALAVTMRTPGNDEELALGFLYGEGLITEPRPAGLTEDFAINTIEVTGPLTRDPSARSFYTTSSCGVCGKGALEEVAIHAPPLPDGPSIERALLAALPSGCASRASPAPAGCTPPASSRRAAS
jgi:FdhD protein